jgi:hypothetical protein
MRDVIHGHDARLFTLVALAFHAEVCTVATACLRTVSYHRIHCFAQVETLGLYEDAKLLHERA